MMQPSKPETENVPTTRRRFYVGAIYALWGIITGVLGVSTVRPGKPGNVSRRSNIAELKSTLKHIKALELSREVL
jgi:hypothetical protein